MSKEIPKWPLRILSWFCPTQLYEEIEGDLIQEFNQEVRAFGLGRTKVRLLWKVVRFFRPGIIFRNRFSLQLIQWDMLIAHFKFAIRAFLKDKFFSGLNVLGL